MVTTDLNFCSLFTEISELLGRGQVVRHRFLVSAFPGSNPGTPAIVFQIADHAGRQRETKIDRHCITPVAKGRATDIFLTES